MNSTNLKGFILLLIPINLFATDIYWIGTSVQWTDKDNWSLSSGGPSCSCNPSVSDDVTIESAIGNNMILIPDGTLVTVKSLEIASMKHLFIGALGSEVARLEIKNAVGSGMVISGKVTIRDSLIITNAGISAIQVNNGGEMTMKPGAVVYLTGSSTENGLVNEGVVELEGDCISKSFLTIENTLERGIEGSGIFINNGSILIKDVDPAVSGFAVGINVLASGLFKNDTCGVLMIDSIDIDGLSPGIETRGQVINAGDIHITNIKGSGIQNIGNDTIFNYGSMTVTNFGGSAFGTSNSGTFVNHGSLEGHTNFTASSTGISNNGDFINAITGSINLHDLAVFEVIDNKSNFVNSGMLNITTVTGDVIRHILVGATFYSDGQINIMDFTGDGLNVRFDFEIALGSTFEIDPN